jgi:integrase
MSAHLQKVSIGALSDRRKRRPTPNPWVVRWSVDGRPKARSFPSKAMAERLRADLTTAVHAGERFDPKSGVPLSWQPAKTFTVLQWIREWLAGEWADLEPRTRSSYVEALAYFVVACRPDDAPALSEADGKAMRRYLRNSLRADGTIGADEHDAKLEKAISKWSPGLHELEPDLLHRVDQRLSVRLDGTPRGSSAQKHRKVARQCIRAALARKIITTDPFPPAAPGRRTRKKNRLAKKIFDRPVPTVEQAKAMLAAGVSHQPASRDYRVMNAVAFYAGLRPSEIDDLQVGDLWLPPTGFGAIEVIRANIGEPEPGEPKNGYRKVPIPPVLVEILREHLTRRKITSGFLFRGRTGERYTNSNWNRNIKNGCRKADVPPMTPYMLRAANATMLYNAGIPPAEIAARLGHSVEVLYKYYLRRTFGGDAEANQKYLEYLDKSG